MRSLIVAEDEELFRHELATATPWEEYGFVLAGEAADGEEAWRLVLERKPDVLLADIRMPGLDGLSLLERITSRLREEEAPMTVFLTGHSEFEYARKALRLGAFDYLLKPLDDAELKEVLRRVAAALDERDKSTILADAASSNPALAFFSAYAPGRDRDPSDAYVEKAVGEIAARYVTSLNAEEVAHRLGISDGYLARLFKAKTGLTFAEYLTRYRMMRAIELLKDQTVRIGEVADLVGYRDQRHFSVLFRRLVGLTPTQFREGRLGEGKKEVEEK
jgi:two-component system, response regulator YesN